MVTKLYGYKDKHFPSNYQGFEGKRNIRDWYLFAKNSQTPELYKGNLKVHKPSQTNGYLVI